MKYKILREDYHDVFKQVANILGLKSSTADRTIMSLIHKYYPNMDDSKFSKEGLINLLLRPNKPGLLDDVISTFKNQGADMNKFKETSLIFFNKDIVKNGHNYIPVLTRALSSSGNLSTNDVINSAKNIVGDNIFQNWTEKVAGSGWGGTFSSLLKPETYTHFPEWVSANIAKAFNQDSDSLVKFLYSIDGNSKTGVGHDLVNTLRSQFMNNPNASGIASSAVGSGAGYGILKGLKAIWDGFSGNAQNVDQKVQDAQNVGMSNGLMYGAAAAGIGAGLLWLYNKFKSNPRRQLSPQEIAYALKLNQQTPNQGQ